TSAPRGTATTAVRNSVAKSESIPSIPTLAKIAVRAAKRADSRAQGSQLDRVIRAPCRSCARLAEVDLLQNRPAEQAVGIRERLVHLEVVVAVADEQLRGLAGRLDGGGEIARLALEFRGLERPVGEDQRGAELVEVALRAQRVLHLVGELHVAAARRQAHGLEVVHAAAAEPAGDDVRGQTKVPHPVADEHDAGEMGAR